MPTLPLARLIWDAWNVEHIARHGVFPEDVYIVCHSQVIVRQTYGGRLMVIGPNAKGRLLAVILSPQQDPGVYYPVTARVADKKEQRLYRAEIGEPA